MSNAAVTAPAEHHCLRCGRKLTATVGPYGRTCARKIRAAAIAEAKADFTPEQATKADELIRDGGMVPVGATVRNGSLYRAVSSKGDEAYLCTSAGCSCKAGLRGRRCYHLLAARVLAVASRRSLATAA
jgi:hypothetical protein